MSQPVNQTPTLVTLANFDASTGGLYPYNLLIDGSGNLVGAANVGVTSLGSFFELAHTGSGYSDSLTSIATLSNVPGGYLSSISGTGDLFGTSMQGGTNGSGAVFEISNTSGSYASAAVTLANFNGISVLYPLGNLVADSYGNLFGITELGGTSNDGAVFALALTGSGYDAYPLTIGEFNGTNGSVPQGGIYMDSAGDLFGTTQNGGTSGHGELYEIANTGTGYGPIEVLASVDPILGPYLDGNLTADANGDLFGTSSYGGDNGEGAVYELVKTAGGYASTLSVLASFDGTDGSAPVGPLLIDANGDLFGSAQNGGTNSDGTIFEIAKTAGGYASTITTVVNFSGTDGYLPDALVADANGNLLGITYEGGTLNQGTVFEVTNSGFVANPVCFMQGTKLATPDGEVAVEDLRPGDAVTTAVGPALVRWVGRRAYDGRFINGNHMALPVTIRAGALAPNVPTRDLHVSPGHGIWVAGALVPAWRLINNVSITQAECVETVTYYHVELEGHALLLAHGAAAESFLDDGEFRNRFHNAAEYWALYPDAPACRAVTPLPRLESGFRLAEIQAQVNQRAGIVQVHATGPLRGQADAESIEGWVCGWAQDMANPGAAVTLRIYAGGHIAARVIANVYWAELREAGIGSGCHGFAVQIPPDCTGAIEVRRESDDMALPSFRAAERVAQAS
jgi:hypothetical protein